MSCAFTTYNEIEESLRLREVPLRACVRRGLRRKLEREHKKREWSREDAVAAHAALIAKTREATEIRRMELAARCHFAHIVSDRVRTIHEKAKHINRLGVPINLLNKPHNKYQATSEERLMHAFDKRDRVGRTPLPSAGLGSPHPTE
ncbi:hypothetical protein KIPB_009990 [Kipferlia bialata]|uniref:Uncharacterized protein n=1 Tax=Kipferlia bialata TaxID=797122 RepID=A0A9K3D5V0_9EUKA|nr:hypothetical protein KIPB_009990 [Kipferlia bialata]|eukprot:g9990.t1